MKTSKKLISIIVAVALLISTIAAVTTLTSSAATTKVSVWNGTFSKIEGAWADQTSKAVITKNADDSVTAALPADLIGQQYQFQFNIASFDKDKIVAAGNKVILEFQINSAKKSTGADDNAEVKINGLAGGKDLSWTNHDKKTINLDFTSQNWESTYNAIVIQNYSNGSGLKDVTITVGFYVEEEATAETTTATPVVETTTATPVVETTTADPSTLVKKAFYNFKPTNTGDTFKTEGWIASESYWGPTADLTVACQKDGSVFYSTAAAKADFYSQINSDWKNVPSVTGKEVYMDFTNNLNVAVKVKLNYDDAGITVIAAGETKTLKVLSVSDKGVLNIMIQNNGGNVPVKEKSFQISALYTLEPGDPSTTAAPETTEEETEPETTTEKAADPADYTAGAYYSKYANLHYAKTDGWHGGAINVGDTSSYISVDPKGVFTYNIPAGVMNSQMVTANYSQDGTENARMVAALEAAQAGSGYLMFDLTVAEAKDKNGKDTTVGFKYGNLAGKSLTDAQVVALPTGKTVRVLVDVTDATADSLKTNSFQLFFKNNNDWNGGLTVLNVTATPIVVAVDPTAVETTTVVETEPETTTEAEPETTTETEPETTTEKAADPADYTAGAYYSKYANLHYAKAEGWYSGAKPIGDASSYIAVDPKGVFTYNVPAGVMSAQQIYANYSQDGSENARMVAAVEAAKAGSGYLMFDLTVNEAKDKNGKDTTVGFKYENLAGQSLPDSQMVALTAGTTKRILVDVTNSDPDTFKKNSFRMYFKNNNDWNGGLTVLNVTATPIVVAVDPTAVETTTVVETEPETTTEAEPETTTEAEPETTTEAEPETTTEAVVEKTNPVSDAEFTLVDENTPDDAFVVALDEVMGEVGETVEFSAYVFNNPGLFAANMAIKYDSDVIRPVCVKMGSDMVVDGTAGDVLPSVTFGPASEVLDENGNELGYQVTQFILENTGMSNATDDGVLFTIKFEIVGKPVYGDTTNVVFTLPDETSFYGIDLDTLGNTVLEPVFAEGSVTVMSEEPETTTEAETPDVTTETPAEPTTETPAEPTTETPAEPTTEFVKPELVSEAEFAPYDAEMFNIVVDEVTGKAGETVDVNITINNNPGIWAGALFLAYDPAVINPVEIPDPTGGDYNVVPYSNVMEGFVADNGYPVDYTVDGYNFKMIAVSVNNPMNFNNITTNGVLATVTFKIAEGAEADDFSNIVFVNFAESKFNNNAGQKYEFAIKEGKVTVLGEPTQPETTTEAPVEPTTEAPVEPTTVAPVEPTTVAPVVPATTTAAAEVETPDATTVAPEATTAANGGNSSTPSDDVPTGAAAAPFAALALAAGAAFVAFKARKK